MAPVQRVLRLTFAFDGDEVTLVSRHSVEMVLPPSDPVEGFERQQGSWYELKDAQDRTLYRRVAPHLVPRDVEVFSGDPSRPIARHPVARPTGVFTVLVPDVEEGKALTLSSSSVGSTARGVQASVGPEQPAVEFARFQLK
jgi:hypothetical protein